LQQAVLSHLVLVIEVSLVVFVLTIAIASKLPLKILLTFPARIVIGAKRVWWARKIRRVRSLRGVSMPQQMSRLARDLSSDLAGLDVLFNDIAAASSRVTARPHAIGPRVLAALFDDDDVRAELRGSIRGALRNLSGEYYKAAALSSDKDISVSGKLYEKWTSAPV